MKNLLPIDGEVIYWETFFNQTIATKYFNQLQKELNWQVETLKLFGRLVQCPRRVAWYGDIGLDYRYSGKSHPCTGWPKVLDQIKQQIEQRVHYTFNFVLGNYYKDGKDYMGWHDDGEKALGARPIIASLSLGASRPFEFQHKTQALNHKLTLLPGSLLVMKGDTQHYWRHRLPKASHCQTPRINLTFRLLYK